MTYSPAAESEMLKLALGRLHGFSARNSAYRLYCWGVYCGMCCGLGRRPNPEVGCQMAQNPNSTVSGSWRM